VLDAGDLVEKGDMVALLTKGEATYEAAARVGYHAGTPGNHDFAYGLDQLRRNQRLGGFPLLAVDVRDAASGRPIFAPSQVFRGSAACRVGVVGVSNALKAVAGVKFLTGDELDRAVAGEVARLEPAADLIIVLAHQSPTVCTRLARAAPAADVFVSGHNHQRIDEPLVVPETGALIVQADSYARLVGEVDLVVDLERKRVASHRGRVIELRHDRLAPDPTLVARVQERERAICPEASRVVGRRTAPTAGVALARLYAQAMRRQTGADVAICSPDLLRDTLPAGEINLNAVNRTYVPPGPRRELVTVAMTGAQILRWVEKGTATGAAIAWDGFTAKVTTQGKQRTIQSSTLEPARRYRVAVSGGDVGAAMRRKDLGLKSLKPERAQGAVTDALAAHLGATPAAAAR
jgi:2',3'-cyclic-nucleotide 2'-phosphodiesterase (5'-nucleotidase family)